MHFLSAWLDARRRSANPFGIVAVSFIGLPLAERPLAGIVALNKQ
jgi:hypothetical protein